MALLGSIIKGAIDLKETIVPAAGNPVEEQEEVLRNLIETAQSTKFGEHYNFEHILEQDDIYKAFAMQVPYFDYHQLDEKWWSRLHDGEVDVTWPGHPTYFALSSGTTGKKSKRIPVTDEMIESIKSAGIKQVFALHNFDIEADFFEKK